MVNLLFCCIVLVFLIAIFIVFGKNYSSITKTKMDVFDQLGIGFFLYYGLFQLIALPCILMKQSLSLVSLLWAIVVIGMFVLGAFYMGKGLKKSRAKKERNYLSFVKENWAYLFPILLVCMQCHYAALSQYYGWDTAYYLGTINTSVYTDTMYIYNGTSGLIEKELELRYALSSFYMNSAVWCKWFKLDAILVQRYIVTAMGQLMTNLFVYLIGRRFWQSNWKIATFMSIQILLNFMFITTYSSAGFLLDRGYEAKAFCANLLVFATLYSAQRLWNDVRDKKAWIYLAVVLAATIPVSMSALLLIPALAVILLGMLLYEKKDTIVVKYGILCLIPNMVYVIVYFLYTQGWLVIQV